MGAEKRCKTMTEKYDFDKISKIKDSMKDSLSSSNDKEENLLKEKEFYKEIDKTKKKNCCSLPIIIIFLIIIFLGIIFLLFYIKNYTKSGINHIVDSRRQSQMTLFEDFTKKTEAINPGETVKIDFSEVEIANYLGIADPDFPLKRARLKVEDNGIIVTGKTNDSMFSLPINTVIRPKIEQQKLIFVLDELATGSISVPGSVRESVNNYLIMLMKTRELYDPNLEIISASTSKGKLTLEINKKL